MQYQHLGNNTYLDLSSYNSCVDKSCATLCMVQKGGRNIIKVWELEDKTLNDEEVIQIVKDFLAETGVDPVVASEICSYLGWLSAWVATLATTIVTWNCDTVTLEEILGLTTHTVEVVWNTLTSIVNGVTDTTDVVTGVTTSVVGTDIVVSVNGVAAAALDIESIIKAEETDTTLDSITPTLVWTTLNIAAQYSGEDGVPKTVNGNVDLTALLNTAAFQSDDDQVLTSAANSVVALTFTPTTVTDPDSQVDKVNYEISATIDPNFVCNGAAISATNKVLTSGSLDSNVTVPTNIIATPDPLTWTYTKAVKVNVGCNEDIYIPIVGSKVSIGWIDIVPTTNNGIDTYDITCDLLRDELDKCFWPQAGDDFYETPYETAITEDITSNDFEDIDSASAVYSLVSDNTWTDGVLALNANGTYTFTPANGFYWETTFTYEVTDAEGNISNVATVTIVVVQPEGSPTIDITTFDSGVAGNGVDNEDWIITGTHINWDPFDANDCISTRFFLKDEQGNEISWSSHTIWVVPFNYVLTAADESDLLAAVGLSGVSWQAINNVSWAVKNIAVDSTKWYDICIEVKGYEWCVTNDATFLTNTDMDVICRECYNLTDNTSPIAPTTPDTTLWWPWEAMQTYNIWGYCWTSDLTNMISNGGAYTVGNFVTDGVSATGNYTDGDLMRIVQIDYCDWPSDLTQWPSFAHTDDPALPGSQTGGIQFGTTFLAYLVAQGITTWGVFAFPPAWAGLTGGVDYFARMFRLGWGCGERCISRITVEILSGANAWTYFALCFTQACR